MQTGFKDHFSANPDGYNRYRPVYPPELFAYLASVSPGNTRAWDCATGTGQAALGLIDYFSEVIATDASKPQIDQATRKEGITYLVTRAENTPIAAHTIDMITVAQALHWFDIDAFSKEAGRVLKPRGILAVWSYNRLQIREDIDQLIQHLYGTILAQYWPEERRRVEDGYAGIELPFAEVRPPLFEMKAEWDLEQLTGYLDTWSAVRAYHRGKGIHPVAMLADELSVLWGNPEQRLAVKWPLSVIIRSKNT